MLHVNTPICTSPERRPHASRERRERAIGAVQRRCPRPPRAGPRGARHGSPPGGRVPATGRCAPRDPPRAREVRSGRRRPRPRCLLPYAGGRTLALQLTSNSETHKRIFTTERRPESCGRRPDYDLNRDASRGSAVRTPRGLIAIAARVAHICHDRSDKR